MNSLCESELTALRNLAEKRTGNITPFVNIADAQHLTELGLASRSRQGWDITAQGVADLAALDRTTSAGASVARLRPRGDS